MTKRWIAIAASTVMLLAMLDAAFLWLVPVVVWAGALLAMGLLLGIKLRFGQGPLVCGDKVLASDLSNAGSHKRLERAVTVSAALAYPATAWLLLAHGTPDPAGAVSATPDSHRVHGTATLTGSLPLILIGALAAALVVLAVLALRRRKGILATDAGGMATMLSAMLLMH
ncbi:hypothetical protein G7066_10875 [Leucobacter coleopterorum]|uniref:RDD family protein n=2 Tax=Leucobacter coleopterorum TaxID=2714933 RepID=A0ABX6K1I1_9MICO|nr:hypothetical protein G7066_10875 [Leucobacter coleopterorum]